MEAEASFGAWVRRRRKALDLLQKELAARVGCSVTALQKIERDERRPSRHLAERLADSLGVPAGERASFLQVARGERMVERLNSASEVGAPPAEAQRSPEPARSELMSPAAPLVGRETELANLALLLSDSGCRLLTLTGAGGIGKTRLALAAAQQHDAFAQGVAFAALAPLLGRDQVVTAIADALGCVLYGTRDRSDQLVQFLRGKALLLVLDNFEHLLADAACVELIGQLLRGTDRLKLLVTSREPLDIQEEWVFDVQGLPTPLSAAPHDLEASSAARLFQQRARQARAGYTLSAQDTAAVVQICQLVGGVPLGIELAATWMRTLSCQEIADEIQRNLDFLATRARDVSERHRSIRAVFDQSWALLTAEEQRVLRRVSVFQGGFTRAAAEEVAGASLALLSALVGKSLLRRVANGRYEPHELVRQYALDQLQQDEQEEFQTRNRHCQYYARLLQAQGAAFKGPDQVAVVGMLMTELANLRSAWDWATEHQQALEISQAADTLFWLYESQSNFREGIPLFGQAVQRLQAASMATGDREDEQVLHLALSQALSYQGFFCFRQGQHPLSRSLLQRSVDLLRPSADHGASEVRAALSTALAFLGIVTYRMGAYTEGRRLLHEGLALKRELGDRWGGALCLRQLGLAAYSQGEYAEAHRLLGEALTLSRAMGNPWSLAFSLNFLSRAAYALGAYDEAQQLLQEGLALSRTLGDRFNIASALYSLGVVQHALGFASEAQGLLEESATIWREIGDQGSLAQTLNQLGETLLSVGQRSEARDRFAEALEVARPAELAPEMLEALLGLVVLRPEDGADEVALEIVLHALASPASTREARRRAERLRDALERRLSAQQIQVIQAGAKGKQLRALGAPEHVATLFTTRPRTEGREPNLESAERISSALSAPPSRPAGTIDVTLPQLGTALPTGTVTFCFTDIEGSTQLWEQHPHGMPAALARHDTILRQAIQGHDGVIFKTVGDGVYAVFARASDALAAALAAQRALQTEPWGETGPLQVRMALHSGVAELRDGDYYGPALNRVARILALGHGAQILLSHATHDLVVDDLPSQARLNDLGEYQLKDLSRPERVFQLVAPDIRSDFPQLRAANPQRSEPAPEPVSLLANKLHIPSSRAPVVPRPRLLARVQAGLEGKLTLVAAPAGYGKTTLIRTWAAGLADSGIQLAWVSLDEEDNDAARFWKYVLAALETIYPSIGTRVGPLLQAPQPPSHNAIVTNLINAITPQPIDAVLIFDDFHLISTPAIHAAIAYLIDRLPAQLHLIITTRTDPSLPLTRLRSRGELTELRAADLRFSAEETATFLTDVMGLPLSAGDAAVLEARTEGWIASLQLAALAMRDRGDLPGFIRGLTGSNRFVVDYLAEEVLDHLPSHLQSFMLQTSILARLCGPLCDAVMGLTPGEQPTTEDQNGMAISESVFSQDHRLSSFVLRPSSDNYSQLILEQLERANLFVVALDDERQWYRYHQLFAEVLRARLASGTTAATIAKLHRRAAIWYEQQGLVTDAMHHVLAAADYDRAAELIEQHGVRFAVRGQVDTAIGWLSALPEALIRNNAVLAITHAVVLLLANQVQASEARLQDAERCIETNVPPEQADIIHGRIAATRASLVRFSGDIAQCVELSRRALELLPEAEQFWRAPALVNAARVFLVSGDVTPAAEDLVAGRIAAAQASGSLFSYLAAIINLARMQTIQGQLRRAAATYATAGQLAPDGLPQVLNSAAYFFGMGDLLREWNDVDAAEQYLRQGLNMTLGMSNVDADVVLYGYVTLARLLLARGQPDEAFTMLETLGRLARERRFAPLMIARIAAARAQFALVQDDFQTANSWAEASNLRPDDALSFQREAEYLTLARVLIAKSVGNSTRTALNDAISLLDRLLALADAGGRMRSVIEILVLRTLACQADRDTAAAIRELERVLRLAEAEGYVRVFVDEGAPMARLLAQIANSSSSVGVYAAELLAACRQASRQAEIGATPEHARAIAPDPLAAQPLIEPLSARELEILRLIAEGHSNQAIADTLIIAVSTVKRHINNIYGKLEVQSRTQALARARELQLL